MSQFAGPVSKLRAVLPLFFPTPSRRGRPSRTKSGFRERGGKPVTSFTARIPLRKQHGPADCRAVLFLKFCPAELQQGQRLLRSAVQLMDHREANSSSWLPL